MTKGNDKGAPCIVLHNKDNVATLLRGIEEGESLTFSAEDTTYTIVALQAIPFGHKIAIHPISKGEKVNKYGEPIGWATKDIAVGEHVHIHNIMSIRDQRHPISNH